MDLAIRLRAHRRLATNNTRPPPPRILTIPRIVAVLPPIAMPPRLSLHRDGIGTGGTETETETVNGNGTETATRITPRETGIIAKGGTGHLVRHLLRLGITTEEEEEEDTVVVVAQVGRRITIRGRAGLHTPVEAPVGAITADPGPGPPLLVGGRAAAAGPSRGRLGAGPARGRDRGQGRGRRPRIILLLLRVRAAVAASQ